ncbi:MAG: transaldolase [Bdellovibrionales bacterium]|nr:transaldolase [Bdellovibrionales bacterium]
MTHNQFIVAINELGQSIWYDNLSLDVLQSGELKELLDLGVSGLTSNPTIFKKAIADSSHYDQKIQQLVTSGLSSAEEICESLMIDDVGAAADLLQDTFERTHGADGYASIEVSPALAHDTAGTVAAAEKLWKALNRPNVMIKIPATAEGIPAIEQVLAQGINVNITLIFSTAVYAQVVDAYLNALAKLGDVARQKKLASVASFFVSRVDAIVEKSLEEKGLLSDDRSAAVIGKVGIANSKLAYEHFEEVFRGERFKKYQELGVPVQRPLWASTGTKNPAFSALLYVEALAGKDTVNTLPPATLNALLEDATILPKLHENLAGAKQTLKVVSELGLNLDELLTILQKDGVSSFAKSYDELLEAVAKKKEALSS